MIINNVSIIVKIANSNKDHYIKTLNREDLKAGDIVKIDQAQLPKMSHTKVYCECDICENVFQRKNRDTMQNGRTLDSPTMCGLECKKEFMRRNNPNPEKDKIEVSCHVCKAKRMVNEYVFNLNNFHFCSRECYSLHKTGVLYEGRKLRHPITGVECEACEKQYHIADIELPKDVRHFCSRQCLDGILDNGKVPLNFHYYIYKNGGRRVTWAENTVEKYFTDHKIVFIPEYSIDEVYFSDFYLPHFNAIVEIYGDYWHSNPQMYGQESGKKTLHYKQQKKKESDIVRAKYLTASKYNTYYLWEKNLKIDFNKELGNLLESLNKQKSSTTNTPNPFLYQG